MLKNIFVECYKYGYWRILKSNDFLFSVFILILSLFIKCKFNLEITVDYKFIVTVLIWVFAFIFTALAIIIGFIDKEFLNLIKWTDIYKNILFNYYYWTSIFLFSIFITSIFIFFNLNWYLHYVVFFFFVYSVFIAYEILKTTINLGLYKEKFYNNI